MGSDYSHCILQPRSRSAGKGLAIVILELPKALKTLAHAKGFNPHSPDCNWLVLAKCFVKDQMLLDVNRYCLTMNVAWSEKSIPLQNVGKCPLSPHLSKNALYDDSYQQTNYLNLYVWNISWMRYQSFLAKIYETGSKFLQNSCRPHFTLSKNDTEMLVFKNCKAL